MASDDQGGASAPEQDAPSGAPSEQDAPSGAPSEQADLTSEELARAYEETMKEFDDGDVVTGHVLRIDKDEVLVDIGYKSEGVIPLKELSIRHDAHPSDEVQIGEEIDALVLQKEDKEGRLILSKKRAQYEKSWGRIDELRQSGESVIGTVIEVVKGGLIVDIGLRGFLPASLVDIRRVGDLHPFVGEKLECKVIELDRNRNNVVLSRRAFLEETQADSRKELLASLKKGEIRRGSVSSIVKFGAFIDLGGIDGLVHVSELSWKHVEDPGEIVSVGQEVDVEILDVDTERERISLSLKSTQEDPWEAFARRNVPGDEIEGKVTKLVSFGVFVEIGEGLEGLVHISELAHRHVEAPAEVVAVGDTVKIKILDIDPKRRRISLSVKQTLEPPEGYEPEPLRQEEFLTEPEVPKEPEPEIAPEPEAEITPEPEPEPEGEAAAEEGAEGEAAAEEGPEPKKDEEPEPPPDSLEAIVRDMKQGS